MAINTSKLGRPTKKSSSVKATPKISLVEDTSISLLNDEKKNKIYPKIIDMRINQLRYSMYENKVDAAYISYLPNIRYLTNFSGSFAFVIFHDDDMYFFTDERYRMQASEELYDIPGLQIHIIDGDLWDYCRKVGILSKINTLGIEADKIPYSEAIELRNNIRPVKFRPAPFIFEPFTQPKGVEELEYIMKACEIAENTYNAILPKIRLRMSEDEIAAELSYISRQFGSEFTPEPVFVTSGERGKIINGKPTDRKIKKNELLMMNFSTQYKGFCCEISRTIAIGKATKQQMTMYQILVQAQKLAIKNVTPGMAGKHLDSIVRNYFVEQGYAENFMHGLGYGIGLKIKEHPFINPSQNGEMIPDKSVIVVAPGIYTDKFGMRIQDMLKVAIGGGKFLTMAPEELPILDL